MDCSVYKKVKHMYKADKSLDALNMDNLKGKAKFFSDISDDSLRNRSNESGRLIDVRLNNERMKALEALQKSQNGPVFKRSHPVPNKENSSEDINVSSNNRIMHLDHTDYVPFRRPNTINISDLITDETINLESSSLYPSSVCLDDKMSFESTEMTGRSTLFNKDMKNHTDMVMPIRDKVYKKKSISVSDILASSFAPKARDLYESLRSSDANLNSNRSEGHEMPVSTRESSTLSSFNDCRSLPRTADMSKNDNSDRSFSCDISSFSFSAAGASTGVNESEYFVPAELMQSKLINDEISWAQEYAAIPTATLSKQAKEKVMRYSTLNSDGFDSPSTLSSMDAPDPNFSVGNFFNMRSDKIWNIVQWKSPVKRRNPEALVDNEDNTVTTTTDLESTPTVAVTPQIDNKTYTRLGALTQTERKLSLPGQNVTHESRNFGNGVDDSYLLSISAIDRALCNLDIQSDISGVGVSEQLLMQRKRAKSCTKLYEWDKDLKKTDIESNCNDKITAVEQMILENKENLDPRSIIKSGEGFLSDTISFTESLINTSGMKSLRRSTSKSRSPLTPIDVSAPQIQVSMAPDAGEEADNDEWPSTPVASKRRIRRTKSPVETSPVVIHPISVHSNDVTTQVTLQHKNEMIETGVKSLSSTRQDEHGNPRIESEFGLSPNNHRLTSTLLVRTNTSPAAASPRSDTSTAMSSPCSYNLPQETSPTSTTSEFRSPNLDATASYDNQLMGRAAARKVLTSPVGSEVSSVCSCGTMRIQRGAITGGSCRSVSRCSSSSEFSHRDGKQIPLKVTNTELSWGSIKLRSSSRKSMQIKNIMNKRLVIRIEVSGPGYQIDNSQRNNTLTLHSQECRTITICFCPTVPGVAIGKLSFYAPCGAPSVGNSFLDVPLYGYGGNASIIAQNISIGPVGSPFVTMGNVCELAQPLERTVRFYNKGPLLGFASVTIDSIGLMLPRLSDAFDIDPRRVLIPPKSIVDVRLVFRPKREEIRKIIKKLGSVLTLANMRVICGDEANRQRIRSLLSRMADEDRCKLSSTSLDMLWTKFPEELEIGDLNNIKENPSVAMDLTSFFRIHEILLTINNDNMDDTFDCSSQFLADVDETVLFRTICAADSQTPTSNLGTVAESFEEIDEDDHVTKSNKVGSWSVTPQTLAINLNHLLPVSVCVHNGFKSRQFFEVMCNVKDIFHFTPNDGYVPPEGGQTVINISLKENIQAPLENVFIMVCMESERIMVPVNFAK